MKIIEMSVSGALMILMITLIRAVFIHRLPKKAFVLMWEIAMLRLLLPIRIPSKMIIFNLYEQIITLETIVTESIAKPNITVGKDGYLEIAARNMVDVPVWGIVRLVGTAVLAAFFIGLYILGLRRYRFAQRTEIDLPMEIRRRVEVRKCEKISSPLTYGLFKPVILLPKDFDPNDSERLKYVLMHELTHIKRLDILRKAAVIITVCAHWVNPFVWVMFILFNRDIELVCDDAVIRKIGRENRKKYAMALLEMLDSSSDVLHSYFSKNAIEERIVSLSVHTDKGGLSCAAAGVLTFCVTAFFAASAVPYKKIDEIGGFEHIFDSPITRVTIKTGDDNTHLTAASGQPFVESWNTFLHNAELFKADESVPEKYDIVIVTTENGEFTFFTDERVLILGNEIYKLNGDVSIPIDKTLYPFGDNVVIVQI